MRPYFSYRGPWRDDGIETLLIIIVVIGHERYLLSDIVLRMFFRVLNFQPVFVSGDCSFVCLFFSRRRHFSVDVVNEL